MKRHRDILQTSAEDPLFRRADPEEGKERGGGLCWLSISPVRKVRGEKKEARCPSEYRPVAARTLVSSLPRTSEKRKGKYQEQTHFVFILSFRGRGDTSLGVTSGAKCSSSGFPRKRKGKRRTPSSPFIHHSTTTKERAVFYDPWGEGEKETSLPFEQKRTVKKKRVFPPRTGAPQPHRLPRGKKKKKRRGIHLIVRWRQTWRKRRGRRGSRS